MRAPSIDDPDLPLAEIFRHWPATGHAFIERKMLCYGCPIAPFHTVIDAVAEYGLNENELRARLRELALVQTVISSDTRECFKVSIEADVLTRLEALAESAIQRNPDLADRLLGEIDRAHIVPAGKLPSNVVSIGRSVTYRDETTGEENTVTPVFPEDADISCGRISILTPIGVALIGRSEGASLHWDTRSGTRRVLTVLSVGPHDIAEGLET